MGMYPMNAARLDISLKFNLLEPWIKPRFVKHNIDEMQKQDGETIWWARWLYFQISYRRWV